MVTCVTDATGQRRLFWATQPDTSGPEELCGTQCGVPQLEKIDNADGSATFSTSDWVRGLAINMLMTDGLEPDTPCGYRPGTQGGHWSESYTGNSNDAFGSTFRSIPPNGRTNDLANNLSARIQATMNRLVTRGIAESVTVNVVYAGVGKFRVDIDINREAGVTSRVGLTGERSANSWIWES